MDLIGAHEAVEIVRNKNKLNDGLPCRMDRGWNAILMKIPP